VIVLDVMAKALAVALKDKVFQAADEALVLHRLLRSELFITQLGKGGKKTKKKKERQEGKEGSGRQRAESVNQGTTGH
jgi:hypothetical protein